MGIVTSLGERPTRWYFLDWLRVIAIFLVFLFHCGRFFDHIWWHLKDSTSDLRFTIATLLLSQWGMPLFFLISGAAGSLSGRERRSGTRAIVGTRLRRLMVPFLFGVIVLVPPQVYFERLWTGEFRGSYLAFYPHYFDGLYFFGGNFSWFGHHLWFLLALFAVSIVTIPIIAALKRDDGPGRLAAVCDRIGSLLFFGAPVFALQFLLRGVGLVDPLAFVLFYTYGAMIAAEPRFLASMQRTALPALSLAIASSGAYVMVVALGIASLGDLSAYSWRYALPQTLAGISAWTWPHALVALGARYGNLNSRLLGFANEAVMPFYILHQTVIIGVGYYVTALSIGTVTKFAIISVASFVLTLGLYVLVIRPVPPVRVLFGMRRNTR